MKYVQDIEVNTTEMLCKSLIRSILFLLREGNIYFLRHKGLHNKVERVQYQGLRTALGYRISTLINVILEETKMDNLRNRTIRLKTL